MRLLTLVALLACFTLHAEKKGAQQQQQPQQPQAAAPPKLEENTEDTFLDSEEAMRSKKYVRRAVLSEMVRTNAQLNVSSFYINHLMGFSNVWQRGKNYAKYMSGMQGLALGYVTKSGHAFELGAEFSSVGNLYGGYRFFLRPPGISLWPFAGVGGGLEMKALNLGDGPDERRKYAGQTSMFFFTGGLLIPLVDVGLKAELRLNMYGKDRWVLTQGIGAIIFL